MGRGLQDLWPYIQQMQQQFGNMLGPLRGNMPWMGDGMNDLHGQPGKGQPPGGNWSNWLSLLQGGGTSDAAMPADVYETRREFIAVLEIPGLSSASDVSLLVSRHQLVVKGRVERKYGQGTGMTLHANERHIGEFERTVALPSPVQQSGAHARYSNGLLEVHLVKEGSGRTESGSAVPVDFA